MKTNILVTLVALSFAVNVNAQPSKAPQQAPSMKPAMPVGYAAKVTAPAPKITSKKYVSIGLEPHWLLIGGFGGQIDARISNGVSILVGGMYVPPRRNETLSSSNSFTYDTYKYSIYEVYVGPSFMLTGNYDTSGAYITPA
ncbi:MAG: hypothetical protein V4692_11905, partial [Bdellovibrionota bacterium]